MSHVVVQIRNLCMPWSYCFKFAEGASDGIFLAERWHALPSVQGSERLAAAEARKTAAKAQSAATRVLKRPSDAAADLE